ncbi:MAG: hypothetical protein FK731_03445 [Asgard group archaeon]|nr:hypothetical protein [Asgard group archaeon]
MINKKKNIIYSLSLIVLLIFTFTLSFMPIEMKQTNTNKNLTTLDHDYTINFTDNGTLDLVGQYDENLGSPDDFFIQGDYLYVSNLLEELIKFDINDPLHPLFLGTTGFVGEPIIDFYIQEDIAYLLSRNWLKILNISNFSQPTEIANMDDLFFSNLVKVYDDLLIINDFIIGLRFYNISNPSTPVLLNSLINESIEIIDFELRENYLYLTAEPKSSLFIYNISDLFNITLIDSYDPSFDSQPVKLITTNSLAYVIAKQEFLIYNITYPSSISLITTYSFTHLDYNRIAILKENTLYITNKTSLLVFDVTNPFLPTITTIVDEIWAPSNLVIKDNFLFISIAYTSEIAVYYIIDVYNPERYTRYNFGGVSLNICGNKNLVYIANGINGTQIIDVSDSNNPILKGSYFDNNTAYLLEVSNSILYILSYDSFDFNYNCSLKIVDVSDPTKPKFISEYQSDNPNAYCCDLEIYDEKAILAIGAGGLEIIDISDNLNPILLGTYSDVVINRIEVKNGYVYAAIDEFEVDFAIFDITNPSNIQLISSLQLEIGQRSNELAIENDIVYLLCENGIDKSIKIINVENLETPIIKSSTQLNLEFIFSLEVMNDYLYLACILGLVVLKKTSFNELIYVDCSKEPFASNDLFVNKGFVYMASAWDGLTIYISFNPVNKLTEILLLVFFISIPIIIFVIITIVRKRK